MKTLVAMSFHGDEICLSIVHLPEPGAPAGPAWKSMLVFCGIGAGELPALPTADGACPAPANAPQPVEEPGDCSTE